VKKWVVLGLCVIAVACARTPGEVADKVLYDFGIGEKPEGHVSGAEKVMVQLENVGKAEMKRMNLKQRHGEVKFQQETGLTGKYYRELKKYEDAYPVDARPVTRSSQGERGFVGYIDYRYRVYQSKRVATRVEAEAASADISTDVTGRETYRYNFSYGGTWDGAEGQSVRR
jgi:hypothetical protein